MAMEDVVIAYKADINDMKQKVLTLQRLNTALARQLGTDFTKGLNVVNQQIKKVQFDKEFKIRTDEGSIQKIRGDLQTLESTIQGTDGQLYKFTEVLGITDKGTQSLSSSLTQLNKVQSDLVGKSSKLQTNFNDLSAVNSRFNNQLKNFGNVSKFVGTSLNQVSDNGSKVTKIFETTNGKFVQLTETTKRLPNGIQEVNRSMKQLSKTQAESASTIEQSNKTTIGLSDNLKRLAKRALLTIPVWFAIRQGISSVFSTIRDGLKNLAEFDRALQKLNRNLEATSKTGVVNLQALADEITAFSLESGVGVEKVTNAIQKFATVGFDLETSLKGGIQSTKLAITLFGDAEETAQAFARSLRVLTENIDGADEKQKAIAEALALTDQLWQTNAFEINEFSQNLTKFAGTANIANISIEDTLTLLATLSTGGLANRAGRLLRTTLLKSLRDIDKVSRALDLDFDPENQTTIDFVLELISALKELKTAENVPKELAETIGELFSVRSTEVVASLVSLEKTLKENIALRPDVEKFEDTYEEQLKRVNRLVERHKNLNKEIGKAFVTGLVGAGNYEKALTKIVEVQEKLIGDTEKFGGIVRDAVVGIGVAGLIAYRTQLLKLLALLGSTAGLAGIAVFTTLNFKAEAERLAREAEKNASAYNEIGQDIAQQINQGLRGQLDDEALATLIAKIETADLSNLGFSESLEPTLELLKEILINQEKITEEKEKQIESDEEERKSLIQTRKIQEAIVENQLALAKARGASESQLIKTEQILRKHFDIQKDEIEQLKDKLDYQRAVNKEKQLETQLSDRTQKLAEIGRTEGVDVARKIGEVLSGDIDFDLFERLGGRPLEVFKDKFGDIFQEQKDIKFLQEKGLSIPIAFEDEGLVRGGGGTIRTSASLEQARAESYIESLKTSTSSSDENTEAIKQNTQSLEQLYTIINQGGVLTGQDAQDYTRNELNRANNIQRVADRVAPQAQTLSIDVTVDGTNRVFSGTPEAIRTMAQEVSAEVAKAVEAKLVNDLESNNSSPISKATDKRIENY